MNRWGSLDDAGGPAGSAVIFLDRDGVVVRECEYLADPDQVEVLPGAAAALAQARQAGFLLIGLSNQSGLGRGYFTQEAFVKVMERLSAVLARAGAGFDGFFYCPHAPEAGCVCRKPAGGLLVEAGRHFQWSPADSFLVGDKLSDIELGFSAGLRSYLVRTGYGADQEAAVRRRWPDDPTVEVVDDLAAAVSHLLARTGKG